MSTIIAPVNGGTVYGTASADTITGSTNNDALYGLGGDDIINGGDGDDVIYGDGTMPVSAVLAVQGYAVLPYRGTQAASSTPSLITLGVNPAGQSVWDIRNTSNVAEVVMLQSTSQGKGSWGPFYYTVPAHSDLYVTSTNPSVHKLYFAADGTHYQQLDVVNPKSVVYSEDELGVMIHIEKLQKHTPLRTILFELIRPFGFQPEQIPDIIDSLSRESGRKFFSNDYRLVKDRKYLIISATPEKQDKVFYIDEDCTKMSFPIHLAIEKIERTADFKFSLLPTVVDLDLDQLIFPLILRHWHEGEYLQPLGMKGLKKLSDFFIDEKYSIPEKENEWILSSGNQLVWIVGKRIDDRYKITSNTKRIMRMLILLSVNFY